MIAPLPVAALNLDPITTHAFRRAGLKTDRAGGQPQTHGDDRALWRGHGRNLDQALGHGTQPLSPRLPLPDYWKEQGFAEPIATEEVIRATLKSLAAALADVLEKRGEGRTPPRGRVLPGRWRGAPHRH